MFIIIFSRHYSAPSSKVQMIQNLTTALNFITKVEKIPLHGISELLMCALTRGIYFREWLW
jgi:hypothetical protein